MWNYENIFNVRMIYCFFIITSIYSFYRISLLFTKSLILKPSVKFNILLLIFAHDLNKVIEKYNIFSHMLFLFCSIIVSSPPMYRCLARQDDLHRSPDPGGWISGFHPFLDSVVKRNSWWQKMISSGGVILLAIDWWTTFISNWLFTLLGEKLYNNSKLKLADQLW